MEKKVQRFNKIAAEAWKKMRFHICYRNKKYKIEIEDNNANIVEI